MKLRKSIISLPLATKEMGVLHMRLGEKSFLWEDMHGVYWVIEDGGRKT